jgi:hypothetical protein
MRPVMLVTVAVAVFAVACADGTGTTAQQPQPLPERGEVRSEPIDEGRVRIWPASGSVQQGVPYQMTVDTHCGLDHALDFDGSLWQIETEPEDPWAVLDNLEDQGIITLESPDIAVYESSGGGQFRLRRLEGPQEILVCI